MPVVPHTMKHLSILLALLSSALLAFDLGGEASRPAVTWKGQPFLLSEEGVPAGPREAAMAAAKRPAAPPPIIASGAGRCVNACPCVRVEFNYVPACSWILPRIVPFAAPCVNSINDAAT